MSKHARPLAAATLAFALAATPAQATDGDILGVVSDTTGGALPSVSLTAHNDDTGLTRTTTTDAGGRYRFVKLPVGAYSITAELSGFQKVVRKGVVLTINASVNLNLALGLKTMSETTTVVADAPIVETTVSHVGVTFNRETVDMLPLNGRDPMALLLLAPGVAAGRARGGYAIAGSLDRNNTYTVDGVDNNDHNVRGDRSALQQDVVREFQLVSNQFSAEFGRGAGGSVNILTQSGTNHMRGRINAFWRNNRFDAQPYFSKTAGDAKQPFDRKTFGGNLGGPIVKDRTHFFVAYEQERETENIEYNVPTYDYPAIGPYPALGGGFQVVERTTNEKSFFSKLTHQLGAPHTLNLTFNYRDSLDPRAACEGIDLACTRDTDTDHLFIGSHTWIVAARTLNEIRVARTSRTLDFLAVEEQRFVLHDRPGFDYGQQANIPQGRDEQHWIVSDTLTHAFDWHGDHSLRVGAAFDRARSGSYFDSNFGGTFLFNTDLPFDAANRTTYPTRYTVRTGDSTVDRDMEVYSAFVQDNWRIRPNLTLNLGVRYDVEVLAKHLENTNQAGAFNVPGIPADSNYRNDWNNVAPRIGFAWDPRNDGKTVVRGGFGWFYDQIFLNIQGNVYRFGAVPRTVDTTIDNPCYPDPQVSLPGLCGGAARAGSATRTATVATGQERSPYAFNTSIGVQREIRPNLSVAVDYVRLRTQHWPIALDLNPRCTFTSTLDGDCTGTIGSNASRPDPAWLSLDNTATAGDKWYNGLLLKLEKRFSSHYQFKLSYTLARTEDTNTDFTNVPQNYFRPELDRARSNEDQRHRFVASGAVQLPLRFQAATIITYASGRPFNITMGTDWNGDGVATNDRPDALPTRDDIDQGTADTRPYNPQGPPGRGANGHLERNAGNGPDFFSIDLRLSKMFLFKRRSIEVLAEAFNLTNRVNERAYSGNVRSTNYYLRRLMRGEIGGTETEDPFQMQLGLRLNF